MNAYVNAMNAEFEPEQAKREEARKADHQIARDRLTPLNTRLEKLLSKIPIEIQNEGLSLNALQASLTGKWRGTCHPGELGTALRKLGFKRERRWSGDYGFRAMWYPDR
jgi:hypothetical protein